MFSKALLEMGRIEEAILRHKAEIQIAKRSGIDEIKIRAMDNLAVSNVYWKSFKKCSKYSLLKNVCS